MMTYSRRTFLKTASLAVAAPFVVPSSVLGLDGEVAPSERITMGLIGCGSHGAGWNLPLMFKNPMQQVVAVCDIDKNYVTGTQQKVNDFYSKKSGTDYKGCNIYSDFRDLVNRKEIDAVDIVTPDHWHVLMAVFAMKAGKDVICEKPTLTIEEGKLLVKVQKETKRVYQTAGEVRSVDQFQQVVNLARNGHLGEIRHLKVLLPPGNKTSRDPMKRPLNFNPAEVPKHIDYEMWTGPAPLLPYIPARHHYNWRWNFAYSGGVISDWCPHMMNLAQWVLDMDHSGPAEVAGTGVFPQAEDVWNTAEDFNLSYKFANGITMELKTEVAGLKVEGTEGWVLTRGWREQPLRASDPKLLEITFDDSAPNRKNYGRPESTVRWQDRTLAGGEHIDFSLRVKDRGECYYTAESGHRTHTIAHMGNISMLLGGAKLQWNPQTETFEGDRAEEANKHASFSRTQRDPWTFDKMDSWINVG
ncbi:MAG: Gfo/Idh/MocA family oxidoreductase [Planctomycetaceae bacterium]|nr:Gfo/Idh/MocA family oxidoreductase [Planctomycetaceae bacterium]